jgi:hypothetical protein
VPVPKRWRSSARSCRGSRPRMRRASCTAT